MAQALCNPMMSQTLSVSRREVYRQHTMLPSLVHSVVRRNRRCSTSPQALALGGVADDFGLTSGSSAVNILTQAATFTAIGLAAWFSARLLDQVCQTRVVSNLGSCSGGALGQPFHVSFWHFFTHMSMRVLLSFSSGAIIE